MARRAAPRRSYHPPNREAASTLGTWLSVAAIIVPLIVVGMGWIFGLGKISEGITSQFQILSGQVDTKLATVSSKVDAVSTKVDNASQLAQQKVDALSDTVKTNQSSQVEFRSTVQNAFSKVFDNQQKQADAIAQERVDRLTDAAKKK